MTEACPCIGDSGISGGPGSSTRIYVGQSVPPTRTRGPRSNQSLPAIRVPVSSKESPPRWARGPCGAEDRRVRAGTPEGQRSEAWSSVRAVIRSAWRD